MESRTFGTWVLEGDVLGAYDRGRGRRPRTAVDTVAAGFIDEVRPVVQVHARTEELGSVAYDPVQSRADATESSRPIRVDVGDSDCASAPGFAYSLRILSWHCSSSSGVPCWMTRPLSKTAMRSAMVTLVNLCVTRTTARSAARRRSPVKMRCSALGSRAAVGSSRTSSPAGRWKARASAILCHCSPGSSCPPHHSLAVQQR